MILQREGRRFGLINQQPWKPNPVRLTKPASWATSLQASCDHASDLHPSSFEEGTTAKVRPGHTVLVQSHQIRYTRDSSSQGHHDGGLPTVRQLFPGVVMQLTPIGELASLRGNAATQCQPFLFAVFAFVSGVRV